MAHSKSVLCSFLGLSLFVCVGCGTSRGGHFTAAVSPSASPLVAQYTVSRDQPGFTAWVEFGTDTTYGRQTSVVSDSSGAAIVLVAGMLPQTTYHMRAHVDTPNESLIDHDRTFTTGTIPTSTPLPKFTVSQPSSGSNNSSIAPAPGVELLSLVPNPTKPNALQAVATDLNGNVIWYCPQPAVPPRLLPNGHFLFQMSSELQEVDLACNTIRDVSLAQVNQSIQANGIPLPPILYFHHDLIALPNGHWIALGQITQDFTDLPGYPGTTTVVGDALVDIDPNGNVGWAWSGFDHLDINRHLQGLPDWTHSNAIVYTADGNLLLSMRHQSWILKIDYENGTGGGNILWKLGQDGDFQILGGDPSQWFYGQHYPYIVSTQGSQTTLAVYDDGNQRIDSSGTACGSTPTAPVCYTRAALYLVDEGTSSATPLWAYVPGYFSVWGGSISTLSNGDVEFDSSDPFSSADSQITEVTQTNSPQVVWQMTINGLNAYRGDRIPSLYPGVTWQK